MKDEKSGPEYEFRITLNKKHITIKTRDGKVKPYPVEYLKQIAGNKMHNYPEPVREMARRALSEFGLLEDPEDDPEIASDTIATIQGVKVYQVFWPIRRFMAWVGGEKVYNRSISEIEKKIKGA